MTEMTSRKENSILAPIYTSTLRCAKTCLAGVWRAQTESKSGLDSAALFAAGRADAAETGNREH